MVGVGDQSNEQAEKRAFVPFGLRFTETVQVDGEARVEYDEEKQAGVYSSEAGTPPTPTNTAFADQDWTG
jgi:hypothetical protein